MYTNIYIYTNKQYMANSLEPEMRVWQSSEKSEILMAKTFAKLAT